MTETQRKKEAIYQYLDLILMIFVCQYKGFFCCFHWLFRNKEDDLGCKQLEATQIELENERKDKERMSREKDEMIAELTMRVLNIQKAYDSVIDMTFDTFEQKMIGFKSSWEEKSAKLQVKNKILLAELGLRIHDI